MRDRERFLALLRRLRTEAGLRQVDVAASLGLPQSFVSRYETGERRLDFLELRRVCVALRTDIQTLVRRFEAGGS